MFLDADYYIVRQILEADLHLEADFRGRFILEADFRGRFILEADYLF